MFRYLRQNEKGQTMTFVVLGMMALVMFWMMVVNVGILEYRRIKMQNAVDAAALTAVRHQARALNRIGVLNTSVWYTLLPQYQCDQVWVPNKYFMFRCRKVRGTLHNLTDLQSDINRGYSGGFPLWQAQAAAKANGADSLYPVGTSFSLRLHRQEGYILWYSKCQKICFPTKGGWKCIYIPLPPYQWRRENLWMERKWSGSEPQPPHRLRFVATKKKGKAPVGGNLLGIDMPKVYTTAEGRTWLNTKAGTWIPLVEGGLPQENTGWFWPWLFRWGRAFDAGLTPVPGFQH